MLQQFLTLVFTKLQKPDAGRSQLEWVIMIGGHHQLPPVMKNMAFQQIC